MKIAFSLQGLSQKNLCGPDSISRKTFSNHCGSILWFNCVCKHQPVQGKVVDTNVMNSCLNALNNFFACPNILPIMPQKFLIPLTGFPLSACDLCWQNHSLSGLLSYGKRPNFWTLWSWTTWRSGSLLPLFIFTILILDLSQSSDCFALSSGNAVHFQANLGHGPITVSCTSYATECRGDVHLFNSVLCSYWWKMQTRIYCCLDIFVTWNDSKTTTWSACVVFLVLS